MGTAKKAVALASVVKARTSTPKAFPKKAGTDVPCMHGYDLVREIGGGASGQVWICRNKLTKSWAALKIIKRKTADEKRWANRELKGLRAYERIDPKPDSLIGIMNAQETADGLCICYIMPLADGVGKCSPKSQNYKVLTLGYRLKKERMLGLLESAGVALRTAEALKTLHSHRLIHRDVKPDNIVFIRGKAVLADIGLVTDDRDSVSFSGTPLYFETGKRPSARGDIYALGKVLYQMINGLKPDEFPSPGSRIDNTDMHLFAPLNDVCMRACGDEENERYKDAAEMIADLRKVLDTATDPDSSPVERKFAELVSTGFDPGVPEHEERFCWDGKGRYRIYRMPDNMWCSILWHPETGAFETHGGIRMCWERLGYEKGVLGYPTSDELDFTDADGIPGLLEPADTENGDESLLMGRISHFEAGCILWLKDGATRDYCGDCAAFLRPEDENGKWRYIGEGYTCDPSKLASLVRFISGHSRLRPVNLDPQKTFAELTVDELLQGAHPVWELQQGPDRFSWQGCRGHLYKLTAPYAFIGDCAELNEKAMAKVRVAVFMPPGHMPDTPVVYAFTGMDGDYCENAAILPTILSCGFGMVCMDTPFTGICKFGADMKQGLEVRISNDFNDAVQTFVKKAGVQNITPSFFRHMQRFTARNLWLTRQFFEERLGLKPNKTVLTGTRLGTITCAFAFGAAGFGDILLGAMGQPDIQSWLRGYAKYQSGKEPIKSGGFSPADFAGPGQAALFDMIENKIKWLGLSLAARLGARDLWRTNPLRHAEIVDAPREIHLLCGDKDPVCPMNETAEAVDRYRRLQWATEQGELLNEGNRQRWDGLLAGRLNGGKSTSWFDGGHDLNGWRGELRLKFLETKLRMLNGQR